MRRSPRPEVKKLDELCRRYIMQRDRYTCQKCGRQERLQWAHIHTRGVHSLRWTPENSLALCSGCHYQAHLHPVDFVRFLAEKFPARMAKLDLMRRTPHKPDRALIRLWLEQNIKRLETI